MTPFYSRAVRIEWGMCDPAGIVFAPRYLDLFSENTVRLFEHAGLPRKREMLQQGVFAGMPLLDMSAQFSLPAAYGDDVLVESAAPQFGGSSFTIAHRVVRSGAVCVQATEKRVWTVRDPDRPGGLRASRVPDDVRARFGPVQS